MLWHTLAGLAQNKPSDPGRQAEGHVSLLQVESGRGLNMDTTLFERLAVDGGFPVATLKEQRRMRPCFRSLITQLYPQLQASSPAAQCFAQ